MAFSRINRRNGSWLAGVLIGATALVPAFVRGGDLDKLDISLKSIPADAAFYSVALRNREQIEAIGNSRAWAKFVNLPAVQSLWKMIHEELAKPNCDMAPMMQFLHARENRELVQLLAEMGSEEIFFYGGQSVVDFANLFAQVVGSMQFGPALMQLSGSGRNLDPGKLPLMSLANALSKNEKLLKIPELVIGFRIADTKRAMAQMKRLEVLFTQMVEQAPLLKGRLQRSHVAKGTFLQLALDGGMVPWEKIPFKDAENTPGQFDSLIKKLTDTKLFIHLGVRDRYLILSIGASEEPLQTWNASKRMVDRPELKPLALFAGERLISIDYTSKAIRQIFATSKKDIDQLKETAKGFLGQAGFPEEVQKRMRKDLDALSNDLQELVHEPGENLGFSFLTSRGQEGYSYDWGDHADLDGSRPMTILNHVGGNPILAAAGRVKYPLEKYQMLVKWLKVINGYVEELVIPNLGENIRDRYEEITKTFHPLLRRLDKTTAKKFLPAFKDGQMAFVLDAQLKSRQWYKGFPASKQQLPMLEPAFVFGVSDAGLVRSAFEDYRLIANDIITESGKVVPLIPRFQIPEPATRELKGGTLFYYPIPMLAQAGIDEQILPSAGLSRSAMVLAISADHADRLLGKTPLNIEGGPLADAKREMVAATYVNWVSMVDAAGPWLEFAIAKTGEMLEEDRKHIPEKKKGAAKFNSKELLKQLPTLLEILKCVKVSTSATYLENGILVTHSETVVKDLD